MAEVPPTPLLPTRMGGWDLEGESLLMDQGPIFGDESMMEMTFEMSRIEDGQGDGDYWGTAEEGDESTGTIVMPATDRNALGLVEKQEDWGVEVASEAGGHLDRQKPAFLAENIENAAYDTVDHDDYYGEYPPSPFLDKSIWKSKRAVDVAQPSTLPEEDLQAPLPTHIDISFNQAELDSPGSASLSLKAIVPEETTFTARGDKPTWAEEERGLSLELVRSQGISLVMDEEGNEGDKEGRDTMSGSATAKRPASSPRQAQEKKKCTSRSRTDSIRAGLTIQLNNDHQVKTTTTPVDSLDQSLRHLRLSYHPSSTLSIYQAQSSWDDPPRLARTLSLALRGVSRFQTLRGNR